jgi:hypothetical protein
MVIYCSVGRIKKSHLGGVELDPGLALDERGGYLHDHGFDGVGRAPALNKR